MRHVSEAATRDRFRGCQLGLAAGDASGTTLEFRPPGSFEPIDDVVGGGPFGLKPGQWTDETSMALCLATSLLECSGFNPTDQTQRYVRWWREGYLSSTGECFNIGIITSGALSRFMQHGDPYAGSFKDQEQPHIKGTGYVVDALEAALWAFHRSDGFHEGALLALNLGDDADTTGAIYGQIAGAYYGAEAIPSTWRAKLAMAEKITSLAESPLGRGCHGLRGDLSGRWGIPGRRLGRRGRASVRSPP